MIREGRRDEKEEGVKDGNCFFIIATLHLGFWRVRK